MDWVDEYMAKMEIHQRKKLFCFNDKYFGFTDIVLPCGQLKIYILQLSYASSTYAQEVHCDFHVLEGFERKQNGDQALSLFR